MKRKYLIIGAAAAVLAAGGVGIAQAVGGDDDDASEQARGPGADRARAAALKHVPGDANAVERDSEGGGTWEVEITRSSDGKTVDVRLDEKYGLVAVDGDEENDSGDNDD